MSHPRLSAEEFAAYVGVALGGAYEWISTRAAPVHKVSRHRPCVAAGDDARPRGGNKSVQGVAS